MSTITKQWLQKAISQHESMRDEIPFGLDEDDSNTLAALHIALASLEAEPVAYMYKDNLHSDARFSLHTRFGNWSQEDINEYEITEIPLYTAPPAPVSVPDEVMAAMQKVARIRLDLNDFDGDKRGILDCLGDAEEALIEVVNRRAAMLQGVENAGSPTTMKTAPALDSSPKIAESTSGNSPAIPDGWALVPVEPTEDMIVNGFESEPDESFSDEKEWEAYDAMSGCQQAAHRAKLCWAAMIASAPKPEA
ncbi:hypothetical protein I4P27_01195 [Enterobacter roggenkampii]|nr:hypothetical protein [Enterobacter roggenkampii]